MDFDGDGHLDILSGCYWSDSIEDDADGNPQAGYTMMLKGKGTLYFEKALPVSDKHNQPLTNIKLTQQQIENYDSAKIVWENICTRQHLVDYDDDGDLDLVNGCIGKKFFVHINTADSSDVLPKFEGKAIQLAITAPDSHSDPHLVDFDGDGDLDLLTGGANGGVYISINSASGSQPQWGSFVRLVDAKEDFNVLGKTDENATPDRASRVWTYDYNHDGKLDLLVGDSTEIVEPLADSTPEEFAKAKADFIKQYNRLMGKLTAARQQEDENAIESAEAEFWNFQDTRGELFDVRQTGHVWLYLQK